MNKIKVILVEDEKFALSRFIKLLEKFDDINIVGKCGDIKSAIYMLAEQNPQIIFIDIELTDGSGLDIANEVNRLKLKTKIIFTTAYNQYAIEAIKRGAFDYLLKPIDIDELTEAINRYKTEINPITKHNIDKFNLSEREKEILCLLLEHKTSQQIADEICISKNTVDTHRRAILKKINVESTLEIFKLFI